MFKKISILLLLMTMGLVPVCINAQEMDDAEGTLEEVIVTAEYRPVSVLELPTSVTVFNQQAIDPAWCGAPGTTVEPRPECEPVFRRITGAVCTDSRYR